MPIGMVYLIKCGEFYKIGRTNKLSHRLADLQSSNPSQIELIHYWKNEDNYALEKLFHTEVKTLQVRGEWFSLQEEDIKRLCALQSPHVPEPSPIIPNFHPNPRIIEVDIWEFTCEQCGYTWEHRDYHLPDRCPKQGCRSKAWNDPTIQTDKRRGRPRRKPSDGSP